jgi:hypothetical protein
MRVSAHDACSATRSPQRIDFCQGLPTRAEIEALDLTGLKAAIETAAGSQKRGSDPSIRV